jgi:putative transposase
MAMAQLSGRSRLRDIIENISAQAHRLYHLGGVKLSRSNLSRINDAKPYELYEALFGKLPHRCQNVVPGHDFRFSNPLYLLSAGRQFLHQISARQFKGERALRIFHHRKAGRYCY